MILWVYQKQLRGNAKTRSIKEDIIMKKKAARALAGVLTLSMAAALTACKKRRRDSSGSRKFRPYHRTDSFCYAF